MKQVIAFEHSQVIRTDFAFVARCAYNRSAFRIPGRRPYRDVIAVVRNL